MDSEEEGVEAGTYTIGDWLFLSGANELRRAAGGDEGGQRRKLEHRASRTLELLCRHRGAIVSQEDILAEVWNGRAISANSIPVVIRDLRQALGDDARKPRHIETVAKRGYRLLEDSALERGAFATSDRHGARRRRYIAAAAITTALALVLVFLSTVRASAPAQVPLIITQVVNATGSAGYRPLARASQEVIAASAQRMNGVQVFRDGADPEPGGSITLVSRLIIWNGRPTVMMSAQDGRGAVIWTGMTSGEERLIPHEVSAAMRELEAAVHR
jgi:DNA-binding winged helix-turn-helix (wHTH) protein